ncbi:MAG: exonuclease domain-containing protein, partial [Oscillospiraceae bacterium]|nr:exonuclease domain-containing protein [Oscillospiraceae bacterium]
MEYIIFDLEWNQPSYNSIRVTSPVFLEGEIIEIGAVKTNEDCDLLDTFKIIITPKYYTKMNSNVSKLTGIKNKDLMLGIVFPDAFRAFMKWCGKNSVFMSWSNNDLRVLRQNLRVFNMDPNEYMKDVFDLQQIFDKQILHEGRGCGLNEALEKVGEKGMEAHDALHDA